MHLISISVDPATDTPERLKAWGAKFKAGPGWTFVTGAKPQVDELLRALADVDGDAATTQGLIFPTSNAGRILTDGVDFGANYRRDLGFARLNLSFQGNWTNRSEFEAIVPGATLPADVEITVRGGGAAGDEILEAGQGDGGGHLRDYRQICGKG